MSTPIHPCDFVTLSFALFLIRSLLYSVQWPPSSKYSQRQLDSAIDEKTSTAQENWLCS